MKRVSFQHHADGAFSLPPSLLPLLFLSPSSCVYCISLSSIQVTIRIYSLLLASFVFVFNSLLMSFLSHPPSHSFCQFFLFYLSAVFVSHSPSLCLPVTIVFLRPSIHLHNIYFCLNTYFCLTLFCIILLTYNLLYRLTFCFILRPISIYFSVTDSNARARVFVFIHIHWVLKLVTCPQPMI